MRNSRFLSEEAWREIDTIAAAVKGKDGPRVTLVAGADPAGTEERNGTLAERRGAVVKAALMARGLVVDLLVLGDALVPAKTPAASERLSRRCETGDRSRESSMGGIRRGALVFENGRLGTATDALCLGADRVCMATDAFCIGGDALFSRNGTVSSKSDPSCIASGVLCTGSDRFSIETVAGWERR